MEITLQFDGALADNHAIDLYDAGRALAGFQRSLALVTHLVLNGEIITQAPSLRGAQIVSRPPDEGSWKATAIIIGGVFTVGSVGQDSPIGHIVSSLYDFVLFETMGFHPDYNKTLQQQYHEHFREKGITASKVDSLIEKTEGSIVDMHRPIFASRTATSAQVFEGDKFSKGDLGPKMSYLTYEHIARNDRSDETEIFVGVVSSYNMNTFKGRLYLFDEHRPIPFELSEECRDRKSVRYVTNSLRDNADITRDPKATVILHGNRITSSTGRLKKIEVTSVSNADI